MKNVVRQIIGSFEDIGKDVARETGKVPGEVAGKALESLGTAQSPKGKGTGGQPATGHAAVPQEGALGEMSKEKEEKKRQSIARAALAQFAGRGPQEESVHEKQLREKAEKDAREREEAERAKRASVPQISSKQKRGDLRGTAKAKASSEKSKSVRQD